MCAMRLFALATLLFSGLSSVSADAMQNSTQNPFDMYQGVNQQGSIVDNPSTSLKYTLSGGQPYENPYMSDRLGTEGPLLLQSTNLIEHLAHFVRERVPERAVHAKAAGAHGWFEVTTNVAMQYSIAKVFDTVGKRTPMTARFSTTAGNLGSPDNVRDVRGLAFKLRTEGGMLDWVFINHPVFWIRDPAKFPQLAHSQKRNPQTNLPDANNVWDFLSANNETVYQAMRIMSDLGTPYSYRYINGFSGNVFRAIVNDAEWYYIKTIAVSDQGIRNLTNQENIMQGQNPDFGMQDLFNAIEAGDYPSWTIYWQIMTPQQAEQYRYNIFDITKEWLQDEIPYQEIGRITLVQNPTNYFSEVEQVGFDPSHLPNGLGQTEDPILQSRLFAYGEAQRYRTGINSKQLPVNCPLNPVANFLRDGAMNFNNQGKRPNFLSQQDTLGLENRPYNDDNHTTWVGGAVKYVSTPTGSDFELPRIFWNGLSQTDQENLISNIVSSMGRVTNMNIINNQLQVFRNVNETLSQRIAQGLVTLPTQETLDGPGGVFY